MAKKPEKNEALDAMIAKATGDGSNGDTDEIDDGYFDYAKGLKEKWKAGFTPVADATRLRNLPVPDEPARFDDISICNDCRHLFYNKMPIPVQVQDSDAPGGMRPMIATVRRCLVSSIRLPSDDPTPTGMLKKMSEEAPIAVDCSHYDPLTDEELDKRVSNRAIARERRKARGLFVAPEEAFQPVQTDIKKDAEDLQEAVRLRDAEVDDVADLKAHTTNEEGAPNG